MKITAHLACDVDLDKMKWPAAALAKLDGVRGLNINGRLQPRTMKEFKNSYVVERFSHPGFVGGDGELTFGNWTDQALCRNTTSVMNRKKDDPKKGKFIKQDVHWWWFDFLTPDTVNLPYVERYNIAKAKVEELNLPYLHIVPLHIVNSLEEFLELEKEWLEQGFEGAILRGLKSTHKSGRCTIKEGSYLRLKRFIDFEFEITGFTEAEQNLNEAVINELGYTERSSHQENKVGKGMIGCIHGVLLKDVEFEGKVLNGMKRGDPVDVSPGELSHDERIFYFNNPVQFVKQIGKGKLFPKGHKEKARFPQFQTLRMKEDM